MGWAGGSSSGNKNYHAPSGHLRGTEKSITMTKQKSTAQINAEQAVINAGQAILNTREEDRIDAIERAIIQINHFTESMERLGLATWQSKINADLGWIKLLLAAGSFSGALL